MKSILITILLVVSVLSAQHTLPFASSNNTIELSIANTSRAAAEKVEIEITQTPKWLRFSNSIFQIESLPANENKTANFTFSVDKSSPVNTPEQVIFTITNSNGERWEKILSIQVSPPKKFELFQNYPNPFNPTTTVSYQLPVMSRISLKIYDAVGREVTTLFEGMKEAGYNEHQWNASTVASGMYIYQLVVTQSDGKKEFYRRKMLVMK